MLADCMRIHLSDLFEHRRQESDAVFVLFHLDREAWHSELNVDFSKLRASIPNHPLFLFWTGYVYFAYEKDAEVTMVNTLMTYFGHKNEEQAKEIIATTKDEGSKDFGLMLYALQRKNQPNTATGVAEKEAVMHI